MSERPILFSGPMVRALLDGSKTQTRRIVKPRKDRHIGCALSPCELAGEVNAGEYTNCLYGQPGDRLWVRETWAGPLHDTDLPFQPTDLKSPKYCLYAADGGPRPEFIDADDNICQRWTPAIHMFRWASRITLEITGVRVERLQDISDADAIAEGTGALPASAGVLMTTPPTETIPRAMYRSLWETINGAGSWAANPWVWVIEFKRAAEIGKAIAPGAEK